MIDLVDLYPELPDVIENRLTALRQVPDEALGRECTALMVFYRVAGVGALLLELDTDGYYHMLTRSALTRKFLLRRMSPERQSADRYRRITQSAGLFDALAAGRMDAARDIVELSPSERMERYEYEEDYCYVRCLHALIADQPGDGAAAILERFGRIQADEPSVQLDLCRAFFDRETTAFDAAFQVALDAWDDEMAFQAESINRDDVVYCAAKYVWVEGLALLRLAEHLGIETREQYRYCPAEARTPAKVAFRDEGYPDW